MKLALILATLLTFSGSARAETFAFVDTGRIYSESTEAKRVAATVQGERETKQREIDAAVAAIQKAKDKCSPGIRAIGGAPAVCKEAEAAQQKADTLAKMDSDDFAKHQADATAALWKHVGEVAAKLASDKHVTILPVTPLYPAAGRDLTDELIRRLNASDLDATAEENARLKAKVAALEHEKAELTKPVAPSVPPPPPIQPIAAKARK